MARKRHTAEEIVTQLRQVDLLLSRGKSDLVPSRPKRTIGEVPSIAISAEGRTGRFRARLLLKAGSRGQNNDP